MDKIKVGVIGLGNRGSGLVNTMMVCEEVKIVAVCDKYADRAENVRKAIKERQNIDVKTYENYMDLLNDKEVEAVVIASSWDEHIRMAIESMKAGKFTAMEVGGAYDVEECWELVRTYEQTKTPIMMLENCCFNKFELLVTSLYRAGKLGEAVHCHGAYRHDLRGEVIGGNVNRHYRLKNYQNGCSENYPTHELGPIAKLLNINRGNRLVSLSSFSSKAVGMKEFSYSDKNPDKSLVGAEFNQGDVISTVLKCQNGETITLTLNTTLPVYYSREFELYGTKGMCRQEENMILIEDENNLEEFWEPQYTVEKYLNNAEKYNKYLPSIWADVTDKEKELGHGGMDYFTLKAFFKAIKDGTEMPVDVYDAATWMCISALSGQSIAMGGAVQSVPDFTRGKWMLRESKDVVEFPKVK